MMLSKVNSIYKRYLLIKIFRIFTFIYVIFISLNNIHSNRQHLKVKLSIKRPYGDITVEDRVTLYIKVLDTVRLIAATEFANSEASQEVIDSTLEKFLLDTGEDTLEEPTLEDPNES